MRWTPDEYQDYMRRRNAQIEQQRNAKAGAAGIPASQPERVEGQALDRKLPRKAKSRARFKVLFTIYARYPLDYDNWHTKILQDVLIRAGILDGDDWRVLEGGVVSYKANSEAEERTEIEITPI